MRLEVAGQRGIAVSFPPLWQWQSRWERRKFREDEDEVFMWLLVLYNEKNEGKQFMVELLWLVYLGLKETTSVGVVAAIGIAVGQEEEMEKSCLLALGMVSTVIGKTVYDGNEDNLEWEEMKGQLFF
ncbi:hypothetical protein H0E87_007656, partial [Populus deltoides]